MELILKVNDDVARKIRGLSVLTGKSAADITADFSQIIDSIVTEQIIESVGRTKQPRAYHPVFHQETSEEDVFDDTGSLSNISEEDVDELDEDLPQTFINEIEEVNMAIKNKKGENVGYEDELMADIQAMADEDDYEDAESSVMKDAAASMGAKVSANALPPDDVPLDDTGIEKLDVLPADYNIERVSGNNPGAVDFFSKALFGVEGNKDNRNQIKRKKRSS